MLNHITLMGRLTRDPELRHTQSGLPVCSFSVAYQRDFKSADGERAVDHIDIVAWRSTAEFVSKYFAKGRMAVVDGRPPTSPTSLTPPHPAMPLPARIPAAGTARRTWTSTCRSNITTTAIRRED